MNQNIKAQSESDTSPLLAAMGNRQDRELHPIRFSDEIIKAEKHRKHHNPLARPASTVTYSSQERQQYEQKSISAKPREDKKKSLQWEHIPSGDLQHYKPVTLEEIEHSVSIVPNKSPQQKKPFKYSEEYPHFYSHTHSARIWDLGTYHLWPTWAWVIIWLVLSIGSCGSILAIVYVNHKFEALSWQEWASIVTSSAPLIFLEISFGIPKSAEFLRDTLLALPLPVIYIPTIFSICYFCSSIFLLNFSPLAQLYLFFISLVSLGTLGDIDWQYCPGLTWADGLFWLWWFPFLNFRWYEQDFFAGVEWYRYHWWAILTSTVVIISYSCFRRLQNFKYDFLPNWLDIAALFGFFLVYPAIVIPLGFWLDYFKWLPNDEQVSPEYIGLYGLCLWVEVLLTVAIPEELFFRGILFCGLDTLLPAKSNPKSLLSLLLSSAAFGIMHWIRYSGVVKSIWTCLFEAFTGLCLGVVCKTTGYKLLAPILAHSLTSVAWEFLFQHAAIDI